MARITGTVSCFEISDDIAFTTIEDATGNREVLILWFNPGSSIPSTLTSYTRIMHSMWISILRTAFANNLIVTLNTPSSSSAEVIKVRMGGIKHFKFSYYDFTTGYSNS